MSELYELPNGWKWASLGTISNLIGGGTPQRNVAEYWDGGDIVWLSPTDLGPIGEISVVSESKDKITKLGLAESSAKLLPIGTVLYSSRATIGKIAINSIEVATNQGFCSFVCKSDLYNRYLAYCLSRFTVDITDLSNSTTFKEVSKSNLKEFQIPLPPLTEQQRIVEKLDLLFEKIDKAIALHQKNIDEADAFMGSALNEVFGELEEKYEPIPLFDAADVNRGKSKHRPRNDKRLFGGSYPFIQTGDVRNASKYINEFTDTYSEFGLAQSKLWKKGTICITIAANIGDVAILGMDSCFPDSVVGIYSDKNSNDYLYYFLMTLKRHLESKATTTAQMNINLKVLQTIGVPLPSLSVQQKVVTYLDDLSDKIERVKTVQKEKMDSLKALKASILDKAFRGEV